jgi:hypothetical protein
MKKLCHSSINVLAISSNTNSSYRRLVPAQAGALDLSEEGLKKAYSFNLPHGKFATWLPGHHYDIITFTESLGYAPDPCATASR